MDTAIEYLTEITATLSDKTAETDTIAKQSIVLLNDVRASLDQTVQGSEQILETSQKSKSALDDASLTVNKMIEKIDKENVLKLEYSKDFLDKRFNILITTEELGIKILDQTAIKECWNEYMNFQYSNNIYH